MYTGLDRREDTGDMPAPQALAFLPHNLKPQIYHPIPSFPFLKRCFFNNTIHMPY